MKIESVAGNLNTKELISPTNVTGFLFSPLSRTCHSEGIPTPSTVWKSNNESFLAIGNTLLFEEISIADRGFYMCIVTNAVNTAASGQIQITINGIIQYSVMFNVSKLQLSSKPMIISLVSSTCTLLLKKYMLNMFR